MNRILSKMKKHFILLSVLFLAINTVDVYGEELSIKWYYNRTMILTNISDETATIRHSGMVSCGFAYSIFDESGNLVDFQKYEIGATPKVNPGYSLVLTARVEASDSFYNSYYKRTIFDDTIFYFEESEETALNTEYYTQLFSNNNASIDDKGDKVLENTSTEISTQPKIYADPGYEITQPIGTLDSNGDYVVNNFDEQVIISQGEFSEFQDLYLNGEKLIRDVDYTAIEGSTKINIKSQTVQTKAINNADNTIRADFKDSSGTIKKAEQTVKFVVPITRDKLTVIYNGKTQGYVPIVKNGTSYIKARQLVEQTLGGEIFWDGDKREIKVILNGSTLLFTENSNTYYFNGEQKTMAKNPGIFIQEGYTYVPVGFICEAYGMQVEYNQTTNVATIDK